MASRTGGGGYAESRGGGVGDGTGGGRSKNGRDGMSGDGRGGGGGKPDPSTPLSGFKGFLGGILGYDTEGDLQNAYNNNPNRAGGSYTPPVAYVPSFPNASPSVALGAAFDALTSASPLGVAGMFGRALKSAVTGKPMSSGWGMDAALAMGGTRGEQGPDVGVGMDRGGRGSALGLGATKATPATPAITQPTGVLPTTPGAPTTLPQSLLGLANNPGMYRPVGGPSPYGVNFNPYTYPTYR